MYFITPSAHNRATACDITVTFCAHKHSSMRFTITHCAFVRSITTPSQIAVFLCERSKRRSAHLQSSPSEPSKILCEISITFFTDCLSCSPFSTTFFAGAHSFSLSSSQCTHICSHSAAVGNHTDARN